MRLEVVLDAASAQGLRSGSNPARWRGHLDALLPRKSKIQITKHHAALNYPDLPAFWIELNARSTVSAKGLAFLILTAARTGEVRFARWHEVDIDNALWTIDAGRMKAGRTHRVPLPDAAVALLRAMKPANAAADDFVFPGRRGKAMSENTMAKCLNADLGQPGVTVHGMRSAFRDWAGEETSFPREVIEAALAHMVGDDTERAYRRGDALEKRRQLMAAWGSFLSGEATDNVVQIRRKS